MQKEYKQRTMTNLVSILKHCPEGTKLYSPIYGEVTFTAISSANMILGKATKRDEGTVTVAFTRLGKLSWEFSNSECVLFPSKDQRDWDKFRIPTKKGDVIMFNGQVPCLVTGDYSQDKKKWVCGLLEDDEFILNNPSSPWDRDFYTFATKEIKDKLFKAMDKAGYTWDGETLKKKKPQFKPFEKVLTRDSESEEWGCTFYSHFDSKGRYHHITTSGMFVMCIPFEGNEHLVGTTKNP